MLSGLWFISLVGTYDEGKTGIVIGAGIVSGLVIPAGYFAGTIFGLVIPVGYWLFKSTIGCIGTTGTILIGFDTYVDDWDG